jgi:hypothetical protein
MGVTAVSHKRELIDVAVSRQVLWVGAEAYPLQNIARAQTLRLMPNRAAAWRRFFKALVLETVLGVAATVALRLAPRLNSLQAYNAVHTLTVGALVLVVVLVVISTVRLITVLSRGTYYALVIETAGTPHKTLVSTDGNLIRELVRQIMKAIDDPQTEYRQSGDFNVGKVLK